MNHTPWVIYSLITGYKNAQQFLMLKSDHRKTLEITSLYGSYFFLENVVHSYNYNVYVFDVWGSSDLNISHSSTVTSSCVPTHKNA
jgi:hypothetical protein